jgi:hypothetical protein
MRDDYVKRFESFLDRRRIEDYRFERRRKHRAVVVAHCRKVTTVIFPLTAATSVAPATPSPACGVRLVLSEVRSNET